MAKESLYENLKLSHRETCILLILDGDFSIAPMGARIHAYDSKLIECTFSPKTAHQFYHEVISAGIYWVDVRKRSCGENLYVTVPIPIQLRVLGTRKY